LAIGPAHDIVLRRWPELARRMAAAPALADVRTMQHTPYPCLVAAGIHLHSAYDPSREAALQASLVPPASERAWLYGPGDGELARHLLRRPALRQLEVVCCNLALAELVLHQDELQDWLEDPRVTLHYAADLPGMAKPFTAVPSYLRLADAACLRLRDQVLLELATPYINTLFAERQQDLQRQVEANQTALAHDADVATLFGTRPGCTCVVTGAGPSLADQYDWLRRQRHRYTLISVDAALAPLGQAGLFPDFALAIDASDLIQRFVTALPPEPYLQVPLVYFPTTNAGVLRSWPGARLCAWPATAAFERLYPPPPRGRLFSAGSVIHPAVDLGVQLGAATVILAGADFAFPGQRSHVAGSDANLYQVGEARDLLPNGRNEPVPTVPALRGFLRDLERFIADHGRVRFLNSSREGALIHGTDVLDEGFRHDG